MKKIKFLLLGIIISLGVISCGNQNGNKEENSNVPPQDSSVVSDTDSTVEVTEVTFATLNDSTALVLSNKTIKIKGTVDHVCKHGGKRLMLVGDNPGERIRVETSEDQQPFDQELAGKTIEVTGTLNTEKIDSTYLANLTKDLEAKKAEGETKAEGKHLKEVEHAEGEEQGEKGEPEEEMSIDDQLAQIANLQKEIKNNGKGYIVNKYIVLKSYKVIE